MVGIIPQSSILVRENSRTFVKGYAVRADIFRGLSLIPNEPQRVHIAIILPIALQGKESSVGSVLFVRIGLSTRNLTVAGVAGASLPRRRLRKLREGA
jgi:hypothetical protein